MAKEFITIIVEEKGSRVVQRSLRDIGSTAKGTQSAVQMLKSTLLTLGAGAILSNTVRTIASFEQALSTVRAITNATESDFARLRDTAAELGATTRFTATQAAEGMVQLSRAGLSVNQTLEATDDVLRLAQAGALDLARAAEITVVAMRGFRLGTEDLGRVTDVLAKAANSATTDVSQLSDALKYVGPVATGVGLSFEETVAAISAMSDAGLQASMAGTGLRRALSELESPSQKTRNILRKLGISADDVKVSSVGLTKALSILKASGVDAGLALEIFADRGGPAAEVMKEAVPHIMKLADGLYNAGGTAKRVADIMDDNLNGALFRLKSAFEAVQLSFGQAGGASSFLIKVFNGLADGLRYLARHIEILNGALAGLAITSLPRTIAMLGKMVAFLGVSGIAVGAMIGLLVSYSDKLQLTADKQTTLADFGNAAWERIKLGAGIAVEAISERLGFLNGAFDGTSLTIQGVIRFTAQLLDAWIGIWRGAILAIYALFKNLGPALKDLVTQWINDLLNIMDAGFRKFYDLLGKIPGRIGEPYRNLAVNGVIPQLENVAQGASERLGQAVVKGFTDGLDQITVFEDSVNKLFDRADEIAADRIAKQQSQTPGAGLPTVPTGTGEAPTPEDLPQKLNQFQIGVQSGMEKIADTIFNYSSQVEASLVNAFNGAEDALVEFVTTGKVDFKNLVNSMLADLTRLLARMALSQLGGALGFSAPMPSGGGKAFGGSVTPGYEYTVGEFGREKFRPMVPGQIIPADRESSRPAAVAQEAPQVNVQLIQVQSEEEALALLRTPGAQKIIASAKGKTRL